MTNKEDKFFIDEIVNDVFITLWFHIDSYDEDKALFQHWLISVSKYKAIDFKRKRENKKVSIR
ncbi:MULTISPECIES: sigma factor [Bacillus]|uniref:sigma factor n=1 Tax=Bacillus TaxID=1386 RepID=UPI00031DCB8B|nr:MULTISPECIES: sigma factor [Bacillus]